jgi:hypothetical protein
MLLHRAAEDHAIEYVEGGKWGGRAVALVEVGQGRPFAGLNWQARLGSVRRFDLAPLIDRRNTV